MENLPVIIFVDDEASILDLYKEISESLSVESLYAESAEDAWKLIQKREPQMVVTDYRMPGMNGAELLEMVRKKFPSTMRVIVSGYTDSETLVHSINEGHVYSFIQKPFTLDEITDMIQDALLIYFQRQAMLKELQHLREQNRRLIHLENYLSNLENEKDSTVQDYYESTVPERLCERLPVAVVVFDSDKSIKYANEWGRRLLNLMDPTHIDTRSHSLALLVSLILGDGDPTPTVETIGIANGETYAVTVHPSSLQNSTVVCLTRLPN